MKSSQPLKDQQLKDGYWETHTAKKGSLACVGVGMMLGAHITPIARSYIEKADVVFMLVSSGIVEQWIESMHTDVRSLQPFYFKEGKKGFEEEKDFKEKEDFDGQEPGEHSDVSETVSCSRLDSYQAMVDAMLVEVRAGKKVCAVFYGHPGVFACVPHKAIAQCHHEGYQALMQPGISAEDCLFADLAIDPGLFGCQQYEASQFMFYKRIIDPSAYLILWQISIAGDQSLARFETGQPYRELLVELLSEYYPEKHQVILYEAALLPIQATRKETLSLHELTDAKMDLHTTLVIPPAQAMQDNPEMRRRLKQLDSQQIK